MRLIVPFALTAALVAGSACSARTVHRLAIVDGQLAKAVSRIQDAEIAAFRRLPCATPDTTDCISEERHQAYQQVFLQLADLGTAATQALRAGDGETATGQIQAALDLVETLLDDGQGALVGLDAEEARVFRLGIETVRSIFLAMAVAA